MTSIKAERGAAFLDERLPSWADLIDLDRFDLTTSCDCVVGQIEIRLHPCARWPAWQAFDRGLQELGLSRTEAHRHGSHGKNGGPEDRAWRKLIAERQAASAEA